MFESIFTFFLMVLLYMVVKVLSNFDQTLILYFKVLSKFDQTLTKL